MGMLDGKVALVTGGSKGLGASTARLFADAGARVIVTFGNDAEAADRLIESLPGVGHPACRSAGSRRRFLRLRAGGQSARPVRLGACLSAVARGERAGARRQCRLGV